MSYFVNSLNGQLMLICLLCSVMVASSSRHPVDRTQASDSQPTTPGSVVDVLRRSANQIKNSDDFVQPEKHEESRKVLTEGRTRQKRRHSYFAVGGPMCEGVTCAVNEVCVTRRSSVREIRSCVDIKLARSKLVRGRDKRQDHENSAHPTHGVQQQLEEKVQRMKAQAHEFEMHREKKQQKRLSWLMSTVHPLIYDMQNDSSVKASVECHRKDLDSVGQRLLDQFKQQQDEHSGKRKKEKRNSTKKELHEDDECICQSPVSWQFQRLDTDSDGQLANHETDALHIDVSVHRNCLTAFVRACDHNGDLALSEKEWCCCFADVLPPCLTAMKMVPSVLVGGQPSIVPGAIVPQCDDDGFYKSQQCDPSSGHCWCVDRNGNRLSGTTNDDGPNC